jgi:hypothetical protein
LSQAIWRMRDQAIADQLGVADPPTPIDGVTVEAGSDA